MKTHYRAITLTALMLLGVIAGCSGNAPAQAGIQSTTPPVTTQQAPSPTTQSAPPVPTTQAPPTDART